MRLIGFLLVLLAFSQPALAREHARHHRHHAHHHQHMSESARVAGGAQWFGAQQFGAAWAPNATPVQSRRMRRGQDSAAGWNQGWAQPSFGDASSSSASRQTASSQYDSMIARHAAANGLPESLVRRVIVRESGYNPRVVGRGGAMGMMQIKLATARGVGYTGSAAGLLDPETNLTYAARYLAGAYQVAGGNADRAVSHYARGYYYAAKRQGMAVSAAPVATAGSYEAYASAQDQPRRRSNRVADAATEWGGWQSEESGAPIRKAHKRRR